LSFPQGKLPPLVVSQNVKDRVPQFSCRAWKYMLQIFAPDLPTKDMLRAPVFLGMYGELKFG
jgi:hypothetical protein